MTAWIHCVLLDEQHGVVKREEIPEFNTHYLFIHIILFNHCFISDLAVRNRL